jgi:Zn finger protein HypA/HybF involved in hydrogenase expression
MQTAFGKAFKPCSPSWLRSAEFGICKLDGYCEALKLAFEHHGGQHHRFVEHFHKEGRRRNLEQQKARDEYVRTRCTENGVTLVEVEYLREVTPDAFEIHMLATLASYDLAVSEEALAKFRALPFGPSKLREMRALAESRGGECLSTKYIRSDAKLHWRCAKGHEWHARAANVQHKSYWCPECSGWTAAHPERDDPLADVRAIAASKSGRLLSGEYKNNRTKLDVECAVGHRWQAEPWTIRRSHWCPVCSKKRLDRPLIELHQLAKDRGGIFLGDSYRNNRERQPFKCKSGHEFSLKPINLKHHRMWCPQCVKR